MADDLGDLRKLTVDLTKAGATVGALTSAVLRKAALDVETEAKRLVVDLGAVDTGNHLNSIGFDLEGDGRTGMMTATIGPTTSYGPYLEYGTRRMAPRPHMGPALDKVAPGLEAAVAEISTRGLDD